MTSVPPLPTQPLPQLFLRPVDSQLQQFLIESHRVIEFAPQILDHIEADQREHGLQKKRLRQADRRFLEGQTPDLPNLEIELRPVDPARMELAVGRPRLEPYLVYLFLMLRGGFGGCKNQSARLLLEESMTLRWWLENLGRSLPPASTLSENLNAVSQATRDFIHRAQLRYIVDAGWDDFSSLYLDRTAIKANTEWPTESGLVVKLVERICRRGSQLDRFGLRNFNASGLAALQHYLRGRHRAIGFSGGKPKQQGKLKRLYYQLLRGGRRVCKRFTRELGVVREALSQRELLPSQRLVAEEVLELIGADIQAIGQVATAGEQRLLRGGKGTEPPKGTEPQRWGCGLHRQGRLGHGAGLSSATGPERTGFCECADRASGQCGRQQSIGGSGARSLGTNRGVAALGQQRRRLQQPERAGRFAGDGSGGGQH